MASVTNIAALWNVCSREVGNTKGTQEQLHCYAMLKRRQTTLEKQCRDEGTANVA